MRSLLQRHHRGVLDEDIERPIPYGQSKTANVLFAVEATRRWGRDGITANAEHPGAIAATNLARHLDLAPWRPSKRQRRTE